MKDLKNESRDSVLLQLFIIYVLWLTFATGMVDGPLACFFGLGSPHPEDVAESFAMMLALSPALLTVIFLIVWNFRRLPIFATLTGSFALWLIWIIWASYWPGFDTDFPNYFDMWGLLSAALVSATPFVLIYFIWFFLGRKKQTAEPPMLA